MDCGGTSSLNFTEFLFHVGISSHSKPFPHAASKLKLLGLGISSLWRLRILERPSWKMPFFCCKFLPPRSQWFLKCMDCMPTVEVTSSTHEPWVHRVLIYCQKVGCSSMARWGGSFSFDFLVCYYTHLSQLDVPHVILEIYGVQSYDMYYIYMYRVFINKASPNQTKGHLGSRYKNPEDPWRWNAWYLALPSFHSKHWKLR